jgi:tetratricopeptide (TPR) repeat protein
VINAIYDKKRKAETLAILGGELGKVGRWKEAEHCWEEVKEVIKNISDEEKKVEVLVVLGEALARAGRWKEAEEVIDSISDEEIKIEELVILGVKFWESGIKEKARYCWKEAEKVINGISDEENKVEALALLGEELEKTECWKEAEHCWEKAKEVINGIANENSRMAALAVLGERLGKAGRWEEAQRIISSLPYGEWRVQAVYQLVLVHLQQKELRKSLLLVQREWLRTVSRDQTLEVFPLVLPLVAEYPELGIDLFRAFGWVDTFLQGKEMVSILD